MTRMPRYRQRHIPENSIVLPPLLLPRHQTSSTVLLTAARQALAVNAILDASQHGIHSLHTHVGVQ